MKRVFRGVLFCPLNSGKSGAARKGEGERSEPIRRMLIIPYDIESQSRNADFNKLAAKPPPQPSGQRPVKLKNPPANGRSILRTFLFTTLLHNLPPTGGYNPRDEVPSTLTPKVCPMPPPPLFP